MTYEIRYSKAADRDLSKLPIDVTQWLFTTSKILTYTEDEG
jgi:hypothetical protein